MDDGGWGEYYALRKIQQMFRRFRKDVENHETALFGGLVKGTGCLYYYNMIEDPD